MYGFIRKSFPLGNNSVRRIRLSKCLMFLGLELSEKWERILINIFFFLGGLKKWRTSNNIFYHIAVKNILRSSITGWHGEQQLRTGFFQTLTTFKDISWQPKGSSYNLLYPLLSGRKHLDYQNVEQAACMLIRVLRNIYIYLNVHLDWIDSSTSRYILSCSA